MTKKGLSSSKSTQSCTYDSVYKTSTNNITGKPNFGGSVLRSDGPHGRKNVTANQFIADVTEKKFKQKLPIGAQGPATICGAPGGIDALQFSEIQIKTPENLKVDLMGVSKGISSALSKNTREGLNSGF